MRNLLLIICAALMIVACSDSPREKFDVAIAEAVAAADTPEEIRSTKFISAYRDKMTDEERSGFVEAWNNLKKGKADLEAHLAKRP